MFQSNRLYVAAALAALLLAASAGASSLSSFDDDGAPSSRPFFGPKALGNGSLTTLFAQNNGFRGNSFDLTATVCLEVVGWDFNFTNGPGVTGNVSIYWRPGTANGFEANPAGWTLLGTAPVTTMGNDLPTHLDLGGLVIQPGETVGIYYYVVDYPNPRTGYTNGSGLYTNADLAIQTWAGIGATSPFGSSVFADRQVNVTVHYDTASQACSGGGGGGGGGEKGEKVQLCHVPKGNPENSHVIEVGAAAVDAHLAHGDCLAGGSARGESCSCD